MSSLAWGWRRESRAEAHANPRNSLAERSLLLWPATASTPARRLPASTSTLARPRRTLLFRPRRLSTVTDCCTACRTRAGLQRADWIRASRLAAMRRDSNAQLDRFVRQHPQAALVRGTAVRTSLRGHCCTGTTAAGRVADRRQPGPGPGSSGGAAAGAGATESAHLQPGQPDI